MSLTFDDETKKHLDVLITAPSQVLVDFCRLALDFISKGPNTKRYNIAAQKMQTPLSSIENAVSSLVNLLINGCKYALSEDDFRDTVSIMGFPEEHQDVLVKFYEARKADVTKTLARIKVDTPEYWDLEWRLEAQVASRSVPEQIKPSVVIDLLLNNPRDLTLEELAIKDQCQPQQIEETKDNQEAVQSNTDNNENKLSHVLLQCDIPNLVNLTGVLETALRESKSYHVRRIQNSLKK